MLSTSCSLCSRPRRWAHQDIEVHFKAASGARSQVGFESGGHAIDVRFNTAELNLFTLALFLLCAPNRPNPLGLLVLDDPLQNMDELTVTTLARGFARLLRFADLARGMAIPDPLHGEDDLERLRQEIPSAVYRLHWQSPLEKDTVPPIQRGSSREHQRSQASATESSPSFELTLPSIPTLASDSGACGFLRDVSRNGMWNHSSGSFVGSSKFPPGGIRMSKSLVSRLWPLWGPAPSSFGLGGPGGALARCGFFLL